MGSKINLTFNINVAGGPDLSASRDITVEAYDKVEVVVPAGANDMEVRVLSGASGQVQLLMIKSSKYGDKVTYKVHETSAKPIILDQEQLFLGQGAVGLLGKDIDTLFFKNDLAEDATVEIFTGRDATP